MKKVNLIYVAIIPLVFTLFQLSKRYQQSGAFFYGFAENKETDLSHDLPVKVLKIFVSPGQSVSKGEVLMEVEQSSLDFKIDDIQHDVKRVDATVYKEQQELSSKIVALEAKKKTSLAAITANIEEKKAAIEQRKALVNGLQTIDVSAVDFEQSEEALELKRLEQEYQAVSTAFDKEIGQRRSEAQALNNAGAVEKEQLKSQITYYTNEQKQLVITAPNDGIIGNILCKEGENVDDFVDLLTFYERNPTIVKGYIHESMILQVKEGDSLFVTSSLRPTQHIRGKVIGLGSRIVEIPERLRKVPDIKTYGREILIRIPKENQFLQKEKVMLNAIEKIEASSMATVLSFFS